MYVFLAAFHGAPSSAQNSKTLEQTHLLSSCFHLLPSFPRLCAMPEGLPMCHFLVTASSNNWQLSCCWHGCNEQHVQDVSRAVAGGGRCGQFGWMSSNSWMYAVGEPQGILGPHGGFCGNPRSCGGGPRHNCSTHRTSCRLYGLHRAIGDKL